MKKNTLLLSVVIIFAVTGYTQDFEVPNEYKFETPEDYINYEKDIIDASSWLINTPYKKNDVNRKEVEAFFMKWLSGSPSITIYLSAQIAPFINNPELRMIFMAGWVRSELESEEKQGEVQKNIAGVNSVIEFYSNNKDQFGEIQSIEDYIILKKEGKLEETIKSKLG